MVIITSVKGNPQSELSTENINSIKEYYSALTRKEAGSTTESDAKYLVCKGLTAEQYEVLKEEILALGVDETSIANKDSLRLKGKVDEYNCYSVYLTRKYDDTIGNRQAGITREATSDLADALGLTAEEAAEMYGNIAYSSGGGIVRPTTVKRFIQIYDADKIKATLDEYFNVSIYNEITCDNSTPIRIMEQPDGYTGNSGNLTADAVSYDMILQAVYNVDSDEQIAVDLNIVKNNGFISGAVDVDWNKDALTLVSVEYDNDLTQDSLSVPVDSENGDTDGNYRVCVGDLLAVEDITFTGKAATLYFEKHEGFDSEESYDISLSKADFVNYDVSTLDVDTLGCSVYEISNDSLVVSGETVECYAGTQVRVPVEIEKNPGYIAGNMDISWDKDSLTLTDIVFNDDIAPDCDSPEIPENGINDGSYKLSFGKLLAEENFTGIGEAFTLVFNVSPDATGNTEINFSAADIVNYNVEQVECDFTPANVIIGESKIIFDEETGTLSLYGKFAPDDVKQYKNNSAVKTVVAEREAVFPEDCSNLFAYFSAETFDLANADTSGVKNMHYKFASCQNLKHLDLSSFDTSNVTNMSSMFSYSRNIENIDLSSFNTSKSRA